MSEDRVVTDTPGDDEVADPVAPCPPLAICPRANTLANEMLRELLDALGWDHPASPEAPREVWQKALAVVRGGR